MEHWKIILDQPELLSKIFSYISTSDFLECQCVNKYWRNALNTYRLATLLTINNSFIRGFQASGKTLDELFLDDFKCKYRVVINGWDHICDHVPSKIYDDLFQKPNPIKKLMLTGRGVWDTCRCTKDSKVSNGTLVDNFSKDKQTNLEVLIVEETFTISSCALLDLISRSPKLKMLTFNGRIRKHDHVKNFNRIVIHSNIERLYWPFPTKKDTLTLQFIVKHNMIRTIHSSMEIICDLLSSDSLPHLKNLSINLNEDWNCQNNDAKRAYNNAERVKNIGLAKNLDSLVVRTFALDEQDDKEIYALAERYFETYKVSFWEQVAKLSKLKFLRIYGAWDLDGICGAMSKHGLGVEYFHTNCIPTPLMDALDTQDTPVLQLTDALRDLRSLTSLRSFHFHCADKTFNIDQQTVQAFKDLIDKVWIINFRVRLTTEIEDFLTALIKRGNQLGKLYSVDIIIQPKDPELADILMTLNLKVPSSSNINRFITSNAEQIIKETYDRVGILSLYCWGIHLVDIPRDRPSYEKIKKVWTTYDNTFDPIGYFC